MGKILRLYVRHIRIGDASVDRLEGQRRRLLHKHNKRVDERVGLGVVCDWGWKSK
jgi:hypothetical protein